MPRKLLGFWNYITTASTNIDSLKLNEAKFYERSMFLKGKIALSSEKKGPFVELASGRLKLKQQN